MKYRCIFIFSEDEAKAKINSLRAYYNKELSKIRQSNKKSGAGGDVYVSKWPHFQSMAFIRDTIKPRKSTSTMVSNRIHKIVPKSRES